MIAGIGCRLGCPAEEIVTLVQQAAAQAGCRGRVAAVAVPWFKTAEPGPRAAALALGVELLTVEAPALEEAASRCLTHSAAALQHVGVASVAEGAALAACRVGGRLLLARIAGPRATCALAEEGPA